MERSFVVALVALAVGALAQRTVDMGSGLAKALTVAVAVLAIVGVLAGERLVARIDRALAGRAVIVLPLLSGVAVLVTGIVGLAA